MKLQLKHLTATSLWWGLGAVAFAVALATWHLAAASAVVVAALAIAAGVLVRAELVHRRETEAALRASEELLRATFEQAAVGIAHVAPDGHWLRVNQKLCDIVGYTREELARKTFQDITHPDDLAADLAHVEQLLRGAAPQYTMEKRYFRKDGSVVWINLSVALVRGPAGEPTHFIAVIDDISERKRAEAEVRRLNESLEQRVAARTAELEEANRELEGFSYSVSHDLRAPLRAIAGFARILTSEHAAELSTEARRYLERVQDGARHMGALIDDLLAFSRLNRQPLAREVIAPAVLVSRALEDLRAAQQEHRGEIVVGDLPSCTGDPNLLKQVYINLLSNALKFTRKCQTPRIEVGATIDNNGGPTYFVRDNGVGFDMRYVHKLFGIFQRLHRPEDFEGTGVGLALVQRIVNRHGGKVWAEGTIGGGATFYFTLEGK